MFHKKIYPKKNLSENDIQQLINNGFCTPPTQSYLLFNNFIDNSYNNIHEVSCNYMNNTSIQPLYNDISGFNEIDGIDDDEHNNSLYTEEEVDTFYLPPPTPIHSTSSSFDSIYLVPPTLSRSYNTLQYNDISYN